MSDKPQGYYASATRRDIPPASPPPQGNRAGLWLGLAAALILLCLCGCTLLLVGYFVTADPSTAGGDPLVALGLITLTPTPTNTPTNTPTPSPTPTNTPTPTPDPVVFAAPFAGTWVNENAGTDMWARLEIEVRGSEIAVHLWGVCEPGECDAGEQTTAIGDALDGTLELTWNHGFATRRQTIRLLQDDRLEVVIETHFTDDSDREDYTSSEVFVRE